jgi:hypothetical protein
MTLQQLLDAMNAAKAALDASPEDASLKGKYEAAKKAYDDAKAAADADGEDETVDPDESKLDDKTKAYIAKLRGEAAKHRTKAKELTSKLTQTEAQKKAILKAAGIEEESEKPEEQLKTVTQQANELQFRTAILEMAMDNGIAKEDVKFFQFLVQEASSELKDDEELSDEKMAAIVADVKKRGGKGSANTGLNGNKDGKGGSGNPPPAGEQGDVSLDQFCKMSLMEKTALYGKNQDLYNKLMNQARQQNRLV